MLSFVIEPNCCQSKVWFCTRMGRDWPWIPYQGENPTTSSVQFLLTSHDGLAAAARAEHTAAAAAAATAAAAAAKGGINTFQLCLTLCWVTLRPLLLLNSLNGVSAFVVVVVV
jgi:hypothetical protein